MRGDIIVCAPLIGAAASALAFLLGALVLAAALFLDLEREHAKTSAARADLDEGQCAP